MKELKENLSFEEAYELLCKVAEQLENPKNKLDENIELYEKACRLAAHCHHKLDEAKLQITDINERIAQLQQNNEALTED